MGARGRQSEDVVAHQPIMDDDIRRLDAAQGAEGEVIGPAGAGAYKGDGGGLWCVVRGHGGAGPGWFDLDPNIGNIPVYWPHAALNKDACFVWRAFLVDRSGIAGDVE